MRYATARPSLNKYYIVLGGQCTFCVHCGLITLSHNLLPRCLNYADSSVTETFSLQVYLEIASWSTLVTTLSVFVGLRYAEKNRWPGAHRLKRRNTLLEHIMWFIVENGPGPDTEASSGVTRGDRGGTIVAGRSKWRGHRTASRKYLYN